ncbi:GNAT family N-acetyltransferase [Paenibacillus chondroitinus]|uniref:GNAT family N-acetyltransferase n=1 Tax=Paenibacillus chondroitinus TaxID=59842 RepID=A0ABU6DFR5_9BACL|nr:MULTISPECIES: GNAT family N-acetyltransferase [Paenibacillus]MCY9662194.1 GNAT family N-acetyltransferase [Paenibacillus anseongense]MEB4795707.1 GNAT family N-acetyltransferase [Paenibacillus chondroitinus]
MFFKRMSEMSAEDMVALWNKGFEGYYLNSSLDMSKFMARTVHEGLSLEHSLVLFENEEPIGFVMNGFRTIEGKKVAWNGGTGIVPEYRGKGFGKHLMLRNLQLYQEQGVDTAMLEALVQNEAAIKLYQKVGYEITEHLVCLQHTGELNVNLLESNFPERYILRRGHPVEINAVPFNRPMSAWQTQWPSMKGGESVFVTVAEEMVGYALFKRVYAENGSLASFVLYQCEARPGREDETEILKAALREVYAPLTSSCTRLTMNIRYSNKGLNELLAGLGFTSFVDQVHMLHHI